MPLRVIFVCREGSKLKRLHDELVRKGYFPGAVCHQDSRGPREGFAEVEHVEEISVEAIDRRLEGREVFYFADCDALTDWVKFDAEKAATRSFGQNWRLYGPLDSAIGNESEKLARNELLARIKPSDPPEPEQLEEILNNQLGQHLKGWHCELLIAHVDRTWAPFLGNDEARAGDEVSRRIEAYLSRDPVESDAMELACRALRSSARDLNERIRQSYESIRNSNGEGGVVMGNGVVSCRRVRLAAVWQRSARLAVWKWLLLHEGASDRMVGKEDPLTRVGLPVPPDDVFVTAHESFLEVTFLKLFSWALLSGMANDPRWERLGWDRDVKGLTLRIPAVSGGWPKGEPSAAGEGDSAVEPFDGRWVPPQWDSILALGGGRGNVGEGGGEGIEDSWFLADEGGDEAMRRAHHYLLNNCSDLYGDLIHRRITNDDFGDFVEVRFPKIEIKEKSTI